MRRNISRRGTCSSVCRWAKDRYDVIDGFTVSSVGRTEENDHACFGSALRGLTSRVRTPKRAVQAHDMSTLEVRSAKEAARLAARRKAVNGSYGNGPWSSSTSEEIAVGEGSGRRRRVEKRDQLRWGDVRGDEGTSVGHRGPDGVLRLARTVESSSDDDGSDGFAAQKTYSSRIASIAVIKATSSTTWQENATAS